MGGTWQLAGYRIEALIGAGGFGEVWRATERTSGDRVALKRIRLTDPARRDAAVSEASVLGALDHPHLVRLRGLERVEDAIVLVLDLAAGGSLHELLAARGRLTPGEVVTTMTAVAEALAHVHAADVVHGDVTPANILFSDEGEPLLGDLGVARVIGDVKPVHTTLPYACPEVVTGELPDPAGDVYMLGACALQALTGHPPPSAVGALDADVWSARVLAQLTRAEVPPQVAVIVVRAMSLEPHRRGTAAGFALDLGHAAPPDAVELHAGRSRSAPSVTRLAAVGAGLPVPPAPPPAEAVPWVADWAPLSTGGTDVAADTAGVADVAPRPARPEPRHASPSGRHDHPPGAAPDRLAAGGRPSGRTTTLAAAAAALVLAVTGGAVWLSGTRGSGSGPAAAPQPVVTGSGSTPPGGPVADPGGISVTAAGPLDPDAVLAQLTTLDRVRAQAFAQRDPQLLARVYASPTLLARDRAELASLVPPGCGLRGVRTSFSDVRMSAADASRAAFAVRATLARSRLDCGGRTAGSAPGTASAQFEVTLTRVVDGWRISAQQPARGQLTPDRR